MTKNEKLKVKRLRQELVGHVQAAIPTLALHDGWNWEDGIFLVHSAFIQGDDTLLDNADSIAELAVDLVDEYMEMVEASEAKGQEQPQLAKVIPIRPEEKPEA